MRFLLSTLVASLFTVLVAGDAATDTGITTRQTLNDINALNYALTLENLEAAFYTALQSRYTDANFTAAGLPAGTYAYFNLIRDHEVSHVAFLTKVINSGSSGTGVTTATPCTGYNLTSVNSVTDYIRTAQVVENLGVSAYDGGLVAITLQAYQQAAATIATVEARHAAYLNVLTKTYLPNVTSTPTSPFPAATDAPLAPASVLTAASPFFVGATGCTVPSGSAVPTARPYARQLDGNSSAVTPTLSTAAQQAPYTTAARARDVNVLNYALTLENLEATFYAKYFPTPASTTTPRAAGFADTDFVAAGLTATDASYIQLISDHEAAHVTALKSTVSKYGGTPVAACPTYNFPDFTGNLTGFLKFASVLEATGVKAYDGAVKYITDWSLQQVAATIATVEARHATYLNNALVRANLTTAAATPLFGDLADPLAASGTGSVDKAVDPSDSGSGATLLAGIVTALTAVPNPAGGTVNLIANCSAAQLPTLPLAAVVAVQAENGGSTTTGSGNGASALSAGFAAVALVAASAFSYFF